MNAVTKHALTKVPEDGAAIVFSALLVLVVAVYYWTNVSRTLLFWAAFILTRPLGAVIGDFLDKPLSAGGLALSRYPASAALFAFILSSILLFKQRAARTAHCIICRRGNAGIAG